MNVFARPLADGPRVIGRDVEFRRLPAPVLVASGGVSTWHSAQPARPIISVLEGFGIAPDGPLTADDYAVLPMPAGLWEKREPARSRSTCADSRNCAFALLLWLREDQRAQPHRQGRQGAEQLLPRPLRAFRHGDHRAQRGEQCAPLPGARGRWPALRHPPPGRRRPLGARCGLRAFVAAPQRSQRHHQRREPRNPTSFEIGLSVDDRALSGYFRMRSSTRRLALRPWAVLLSATGWSGP